MAFGKHGLQSVKAGTTTVDIVNSRGVIRSFPVDPAEADFFVEKIHANFAEYQATYGADIKVIKRQRV